jgi:hypothetical protein
MLRFIPLVILLTSSCIGQVGPTRDLFIDVIESKKGTQVEPIAPENFVVKLNGNPVTVVAAERRQIRPRVAIILDTSGSMVNGRTWKPAFTLAASFVQGLSGRADLAVVLFGDKLARMMSDKNGTKPILDELVESYQRKDKRIGAGRTQLRDAIITTMNHQQLKTGDAVIVITDGGENYSRTSEETLRNNVVSSGVRFFSFIIAPLSPSTPEERVGPIPLRDLSQRTGGTSVLFENFTEDALITASGQSVQRILRPCVLQLALPDDASGKLSIKYQEGSGKAKGIDIITATKLLAKLSQGNHPNDPQ